MFYNLTDNIHYMSLFVNVFVTEALNITSLIRNSGVISLAGPRTFGLTPQQRHT
jgi:hypothetical protein